jgi:hypothetical protein
MLFSGMLRCAALIRTNVSEERIVSIIRGTRIGELRKLAVISNRNILLVFLRSVLVLITLFLPRRFL